MQGVDISHLGVQSAPGYESVWINMNIHNSLLNLDKDLNIIPDLAKKWEASPDGLTYPFFLVVEYANAHALFSQPKHPYTVGLLNCYPEVDGPRKQLEAIEGVVPDLINLPSGCRFHPRCKHAMPMCSAQEPRLEAVDEGHLVSCHLYGTTDQHS